MGGGPPRGFRPRPRKPQPTNPNPLAAKPPAPRKPTNSIANAASGQPNALTNGAQQVQPQSVRPHEDYEEIYIITTKRSLIEGMKHHILRFAPSGCSNEQTVNVFDESQFERPIRLHRRDPRSNNMNRVNGGQDGDGEIADGKWIDAKEKERQEMIKAEKRAEREAQQALIAPTTKSQKPRKDKPRRNDNFVQSYSDNVNKQRNMAIRYEEKMPWHVEDFESKQVWSGLFEEPLSGKYIALVEGKDQNARDVYRMLPLQKWYKFHRKDTFQGLSFQEAMAAMEKGARDPFTKDPRWIKNARQAELDKRHEGMNREFQKVFSRQKVSDEQRMMFAEDEQRERAVDADEIDFNADEDFADDEEGPDPVGKDEEEDAKETNQRMKKERLEANAFEIKDQKDWDAEEAEEKRKRKQEKKHRKRMRKALHEHEKNFDFDEESEEDNTSDDSQDSEIERLKEQDRRQDEERKASDNKTAKDKPLSSAPTVRTATPNSVRPAKADDPRRKILKRVGSPGLSDVSGNESSARKKLKQKHPASTLASNGASISRPGSPENNTASGSTNIQAPAPQRPGAKANLEPGAKRAGSGSDVEVSDGSSFQSRKKGSGNVSPHNSRPGSPNGVQGARKVTGQS